MRLLSDLIRVCDQLGVRQLIAVIGDSDNHASINIYMLNADLIRSGFYHQQAINMAAGSTLCCCNAGSAREIVNRLADLDKPRGWLDFRCRELRKIALVVITRSSWVM